MKGTEGSVYVVDDDLSVREGISGLVRSAGWMAATFASGEEFLAAPPPRKPSCLVLDVSLPGLNGLDLQRELVKSGVDVPIIFLTGFGDIAMTVRAVKAGAANFLTKPFESEDLLNAIEQCLTTLLGHQTRSDESLGNIIGESRALRGALAAIQVVAPTTAAVLIEGETGTGKELVARAVHELSGHSKGPFIKVNCAAIPASLLESELFGHERGAFTGAISQRIGRFESANRGTIFLDEIGELPLELQPKLLRVLQEREFERIGSTRTLRTDARIIAATNRDLKAMVEDQKFRSDLYYRLNVFPIRVPALRDRKEDIPRLARHFVQEFSRRNNRAIDTIPSEAMDALIRYAWPGNIRELQNVIERAVIVSRGPVLNVPLAELMLEVSDQPATASQETLQGMLDETERTQILRVLKETNWVISGASGAAARLGMKRSTLQLRMQKLGIRVARAAACD